MIVDASAILALFFDEPESERFEAILAEAQGTLVISPVNYLEAAMRVDRLKPPTKAAEFDRLMAFMRVEIVKTTPEQALLAREAYRKFGKGNHPAKLNMGDCFAYALSKARSEALLYKGDDFRQTDVEAAA